MGKRQKINDIEKYYIISNPEGLDNKALAAKIGCVIRIVEGLRSQPVPKTVIQTDMAIIQEDPKPVGIVIHEEVPQPQQPQGMTAGQLMGRNPKYGVVVMTPAAAEVADETSSMARKNKGGSSKYANDKVIHKIKG